jgi:hypothetical protein
MREIPAGRGWTTYDFANYLALLLAYLMAPSGTRKLVLERRPHLEQKSAAASGRADAALPIRAARRWIQKLRIGRIDRTA